jgi:hypothetical protein
MTARLVYERDELLAEHDYAAPHVVAGVRMHGGLRADGTYQPPRALVREPALDAWTAALQARGGDLLDADASLLGGVRLPARATIAGRGKHCLEGIEVERAAPWAGAITHALLPIAEQIPRRLEASGLLSLYRDLELPVARLLSYLVRPPALLLSRGCAAALTCCGARGCGASQPARARQKTQIQNKLFTYFGYKIFDKLACKNFAFN